MKSISASVFTRAHRRAFGNMIDRDVVKAPRVRGAPSNGLNRKRVRLVRSSVDCLSGSMFCVRVGARCSYKRALRLRRRGIERTLVLQQLAHKFSQRPLRLTMLWLTVSTIAERMRCECVISMSSCFFFRITFGSSAKNAKKCFRRTF